MSLRLLRVYGQALRLGAPVFGKRRFGVPPGGAFDQESYALSLALLGLAPEEMVWEIAGSAELEVGASGTLSVVGAPTVVTVDGEPRPSNAAWIVDRGQVVRVSASRQGARVYVAASSRTLAERRLADLPSSLARRRIRLLRGPDAVEFPLEGWTVAPASDRLGLRLLGPGVPHSIELPSRPTVPGTIQITPSGMPILLGPDGPTIGGYPQGAVVVERDQSVLGQLCVGEAVGFEWIDVETARDLQSAHQTHLSRLGTNLRLMG